MRTETNRQGDDGERTANDSQFTFAVLIREGLHMAPHLKVYRIPEEEDNGYDSGPEPTVHIRLGDLLPLVAMAQKLNFIWLKDFLDDEVCITQDLHQVLQTFRGCRPSA